MQTKVVDVITVTLAILLFVLVLADGAWELHTNGLTLRAGFSLTAASLFATLSISDELYRRKKRRLRSQGIAPHLPGGRLPEGTTEGRHYRAHMEPIWPPTGPAARKRFREKAWGPDSRMLVGAVACFVYAIATIVGALKNGDLEQFGVGLGMIAVSVLMLGFFGFL